MLRGMLSPALARSLEWYAAGEPPAADPEVCASRDVFEGRLDGLLRELLRSGWSENAAALLVAVLGEVGNNCFDHNLGRWRDAAGCRLGREMDVDPSLFWVVDRGVGILETLRRADPTLQTPQQAIEAAFARVLSGRAPERRGNGLKFVRAVVNEHESRALLCRSQNGVARFGGLVGALVEAEERLAAVAVPGVAFVLAWRAER